MKNNTFVAAYCRSARECDLSIKRQKLVLLSFAAEYGYADVRFYIDNGGSGNDPNRSALAAMNADIAAGKVSAVIAKDIARVWRDVVKSLGWLDWLNSLGVAFNTADGAFDDNKSFLSFMRTLNEAVVRIPAESFLA